MAHSKVKSRIRSVVFCILSFVLSLCLFSLSVCTMLTFTLFNKDYIFNNMNSSNYFIDKTDELKVSLTDLGYASGLDSTFFDGFIDEVLISNDTSDYLEAFYSFENKSADTTNFENVLNEQISEYAQEKNIKVNDKARKTLVEKAAKIYRNTIEIPFFGTVFPYMKSAMKVMPFIIGGLVLFSAIIIFVFFKAGRWKHRTLRYICYSTSANFLALIVIPAYLYFSQIMTKINLASRAFYNFVQYTTNSFIIMFLVCAILFLLISIALLIRHNVVRKKYTNS